MDAQKRKTTGVKRRSTGNGTDGNIPHPSEPSILA
jgi:hypothetical protein